MELSLNSITASSVADFNFSDSDPETAGSRSRSGSAVVSTSNSNDRSRSAYPFSHRSRIQQHSSFSHGSSGTHKTTAGKTSFLPYHQNYTSASPLLKTTTSSSLSPSHHNEDLLHSTVTTNTTCSMKSTGIQTDPITSGCALDLLDCSDIYAYDHEDDVFANDQAQIKAELADINWTVSIPDEVLLSRDDDRRRPVGPDVELMTIGHRLHLSQTPDNMAVDSMQHDDLDSTGDEQCDSDCEMTAFTPPLKSFIVKPAASLIKPLATKPHSNMVILDYHPISPPSSEITAPSDNLSDVSTLNSSIISTPNSAKYAAILAHSDKHKSAFSRPSSSSSHNSTGGNGRVVGIKEMTSHQLISLSNYSSNWNGSAVNNGNNNSNSVSTMTAARRNARSMSVGDIGNH